MRRLALSLLLLAALGLVDGGLLRPCHCSEEGALSCGVCPKSRAGREASRLPPCCQNKAAHKGPQTPDDGFRICPAPREPRAEPDAAPVLAIHLLPLFLDAPVAHAPALFTAELARGEMPRAIPPDGPWRLAPEGLAVFLT